MPYDESLAAKVRQALATTPGLTEKKMFGGIAFLVDGAMCVGVDKHDLIVRGEKDETEHLLTRKGVREFDLSGGRPMKGWLLVGPDATRTPSGLRQWIDFACAHLARHAGSAAKKGSRSRARPRKKRQNRA